MVQKVLATHHLYYASAWLFLSSQVNMIDKILRDFLWLDGKGNRKRHCVKWAWCCQEKMQGGLGLKDIKTQGYALASKWMVKALWGNEPWKILIRNNILRSIIRKGKLWKDIPLLDIVFGDFNMKIFGSKIFQVFLEGLDSSEAVYSDEGSSRRSPTLSGQR